MIALWLKKNGPHRLFQQPILGSVSGPLARLGALLLVPRLALLFLHLLQLAVLRAVLHLARNEGQSNPSCQHPPTAQWPVDRTFPNKQLPSFKRLSVHLWDAHGHDSQVTACK